MPEDSEGPLEDTLPEKDDQINALAYLALYQAKQDKATGLDYPSNLTMLYLLRYDEQFREESKIIAAAVFYKTYLDRARERVAQIKQQFIDGEMDGITALSESKHILSIAEEYEVQLEILAETYG